MLIQTYLYVSASFLLCMITNKTTSVGIPTVFSFLCLVQLEKSREATDEANLRAAYAEVMASALNETKANDDVKGDKDNGWTVEVDATQTQDNWVSGASVNIGGKDVSASTTGWTVTADATGEVTFTAK